MRRGVDLIALAACLAALFAACMPHSRPTSPAAADHTWQITGHRAPGVSAMTDAEASSWHGEFIHLQAQRATNGRTTCTTPVYEESTHPAGPFLDTGYRLRPQALGVPATAEVRVIDVICAGEPWTTLGGRVLSFGSAGDYAVWNGVFFRLRRVHL